jgi:hypothetical protein
MSDARSCAFRIKGTAAHSSLQHQCDMSHAAQTTIIVISISVGLQLVGLLQIRAAYTHAASASALIGKPDLPELPNRNAFDRQAPQPHQRSGPDEYPPNHETTQPAPPNAPE